jgi:hypothetical protein
MSWQEDTDFTAARDVNGESTAGKYSCLRGRISTLFGPRATTIEPRTLELVEIKPRSIEHSAGRHLWIDLPNRLARIDAANNWLDVENY